MKRWKKRTNYIPTALLGTLSSWSHEVSHVRLSVIPWTVAHQAPPSMEFSRQEYWSGLPFPSPRDLPYPGIEPGYPTLCADALPSEPPGNHSPGHSELLLIHTTILGSQVIFFPVRQLLSEENRGLKRLDSTKDFFKRKRKKTPKSNT